NPSAPGQTEVDATAAPGVDRADPVSVPVGRTSAAARAPRWRSPVRTPAWKGGGIQGAVPRQAGRTTSSPAAFIPSSFPRQSVGARAASPQRSPESGAADVRAGRDARRGARERAPTLPRPGPPPAPAGAATLAGPAAGGGRAGLGRP